jgi:hypothetical protein
MLRLRLLVPFVTGGGSFLAMPLPQPCRIALALALLQFPAAAALAQTVNFAYTGAAQSFTVPAGVTSVTLVATGAGGGGGGLDSNGNGGNGGAGATVSGTYAVTPGTVLYVYVGGGGGLGGSGVTCTGGGAGGTNSQTGGTGGAAGCSGSSGAGGGGGAASGVVTATGTVLLVAGGGGGGQGGAYNSNTALAGTSATATGTVSTLAAGASAATFSGDGGGGGGGGAGCPAGAAGGGHADGANAGTAAGAGGSCANTSLVSNFQVQGATGGAGGAGSSASVGGSGGSNGGVMIAYAYGATQSFVYTGSLQTYTVPAGVSWVTLTLDAAGGGGAGADSAGNGGNGGYGASVSGTYPVTAGTVLDIYVGGAGQGGNTSTGAYSCTNSAGAGGWSDFAGAIGGEAGCSGWSGSGGGGGGASTVTTSTGSVLIVAGGGGGGQGGSLSQAGIVGANATASGALPGSAGTAGVSFGGDGGGGGGGGGGCAGGAAGVGHADNTSGGTVAGAGGSCANTPAVSNFQVLGQGGAGGLGATAAGNQGGTGGNGIVFIGTSNGPDHYAVTHASTGVNCQPQPVTIIGHTNTHTVAPTTTTIAVTTGTGHGDWALTTGSGTFSAGASNSGTASYTYVTGDNGSVVLSLRDTYAETVTMNVTDGIASQTSGSALASENTTLTFAPSGFRITNGANVATSIATQVAGVNSSQSLALQAIRTDTSTGACTAVFASGTTVNVSLGYQCNNPSTCVSGQTLTVTNNGTTTSIASNPATSLTNYTSVPLKFSTANAEAPIALNYSDVGQILLAARYSIPLGNGSSSANTMTGTGQFVVVPYGFNLSGIKRSSDSFANPAAATATGTAFIGAGAAFSATVTAVNAAGAATPNFGRENTPAAVNLSTNLVLPSSGDNPSLVGSFGSFSSGVASGSAFSWPEVGIITLTPSTPSYLGTTTVIGTSSGNVGRFIPYALSTATNAPLFATACASGAFTYVGQPFSYNTAPVITVTPQALGGATTKNYTGALFRLTNTSLTGRSYTATPASPALTTTGLPAATSDPSIADLGTGVGTLTFSAGSGLFFAHGTTPSAPFSANIMLSVNVIDLDGVSASNPVTFGTGTGIAFNYGANEYYGRLVFGNALGSELLDLPMQLTTQYYAGASVGFTSNPADNCSAAPAIGFSNYQLNLHSGATCVRDSGGPGSSGAGCAAAASAGLAYKASAAAGNFNLWLAAPGAGNSGAVTVTATAPVWLQYPWNAGSGSLSSPSALATFGVFQGPAARIYQKEVY